MDLSNVTDFKNFGNDYYPGLLGINITNHEKGHMNASLTVQKHHLAPNGYLHAGLVVSIADTVAGYGCLDNLPENGKSFTTIELKSNFVGTVREGDIEAKGKLIHGGRTTQIWDVEVLNKKTGKLIARFSCTQLILY